MLYFFMMKLINHAGPIRRNCMSRINDGFLPSILWPTNWKTHAITKIDIQISTRFNGASRRL